jgi:hypothetical protein
MRRSFVLSFAISLGLVFTAQATPMIVIGSIPNFPIAALTPVDIYVTGVGPGADAIGAIDLVITVGSGLDHAPIGQPKIASVDVVTGTIFADNSSFSAPGEVLYGNIDSGNLSDQAWNIDDITISGVITHSGKIATVYLDTLNANPGIYALNVFHSWLGTSVYANEAVVGVTFLGADGSLTIPNPNPPPIVPPIYPPPPTDPPVNPPPIVDPPPPLAPPVYTPPPDGYYPPDNGPSPIPEPSTVVLAAFGFAGLAAWRWRRQAANLGRSRTSDGFRPTQA